MNTEREQNHGFCHILEWFVFLKKQSHPALLSLHSYNFLEPKITRSWQTFIDTMDVRLLRFWLFHSIFWGFPYHFNCMYVRRGWATCSLATASNPSFPHQSPQRGIFPVLFCGAFFSVFNPLFFKSVVTAAVHRCYSTRIRSKRLSRRRSWRWFSVGLSQSSIWVFSSLFFPLPLPDCFHLSEFWMGSPKWFLTTNEINIAQSLSQPVGLNWTT